MSNFVKENEGLLKIIGMALVLLLVLSAVSFGIGTLNQIKEGRYIGKDAVTRNTITVSGEGEVFAKPDLAAVNFTVLEGAKTVEVAMEAGTTAMNEIIEKMESLEIEEKDLKTTSFSINPRYEWRSEKILSFPSEGRRVLVEYEVRQILEVKIRDMDKIGEVIKAGTDFGANQVGGVNFTVENEDKFKEEARKLAINEAKQKARKLASQLGVNLVEIVNFHENGTSPRYYSKERMQTDAMGKGSGTTPNVETGENLIKVNVNITYEID